MPKPRGIIGVTRVQPGKKSTKVDFLPIDFPESKDEIESFIMKAFLDSVPLDLIPAPFIDVKHLPQNDFDFVDCGASKPTYIELMEIAPLETTIGGYSQAANIYNAGELVDYILGKILEKATSYRVDSNTRFVLLLYITDWKFYLSPTVISLLQYWTQKFQEIFSEIYYFKPRTNKDGEARRIFPTPLDYWSGFDPDKFIRNQITNLNPTEFEVVPD
jgi:hypothetical protein